MSAESPAVKAVLGALVSMVKAVKTAKADGWQPAVDVPALLQEALKDVSVAMEQGQAAVAEMQAHPLAAAQVALSAVIEIVELLK